MNCDDVRTRLTECIDRNESPHGTLRAHIERCEDCRLAWTAGARVHTRLLQAAARLESVAGVDAVMARLDTPSMDRARNPLSMPTIRWIGIAAAAIVITIGWNALPSGTSARGSGGLAFAEMAHRVQQTQSVAFSLRLEVDGKTVMSGELVDTRDVLRIVEGDGRIGIGDRRTGRGIVFDPAAKTYRTLDPLPEFPDVYETMRALVPADGSAVETRLVDGRTLDVFHAKAFDGGATVLADPQTHLPVRLEWVKETALPDGRLVLGTVIADDIQWDEPIDQSRLDMTPPEGYEALSPVEFSRGAVATSSADVSIEERVRRLVQACVQYGNSMDGCWPESLADVEPQTPRGLLSHPDRPQYDVGYVYVKPSGVVLWESKEQRRVIIHERFDEWPGSVVVGYTDSSVERITDRNRFDELVRDAASRAGTPGSPTPMQNRVRNIVFACTIYTQTSEGRWPDKLAQVEKFIFEGKLRHPNRPDEPIGFEYVRPKTDKLVFGGEKRLMVYERFDSWPGQVAVGFTDGSAEVVSDPARFEELLAAARN